MQKMRKIKMKQTAVEYLKNTLYAYLDKEDKEYTDTLFTKAKQMEKEQNGNTWDAAIKAHENRSGVISRSICDFDEYYNETYGDKK